ncbi:MAG TPA: FAD-dependent oxidoreductase [Anaerolineaceae bacterium]|nr:FAD-dependent oxidoreductase [Anaerolineaceae bacterium]
MTKPVILIVDDDLQVLNAVERDLRLHFHGEYRIAKAPSGKEALAAVEQFWRRGTPLALMLVDQRMPEMSGTEFLSEAIKIFPQARKVLLTAYADTQAAIQSINEIGLDYYLMKPWDPPELHLFPVLDDLLSDWLARVTLPYEGIRVAGTLWSAACHVVKDFLSRNLIPYQWLDIEVDEQAYKMVVEATQGDLRLPAVFFPDGSVLVEPALRDLAERVGMQTRPAQSFYDLAIVGAGPSGLAAAVYGASEGLRTVMIEREAAGGQAGTSSRIDNYLGFPNGLSGADLTRRAVAQAQRFGAEILTAEEATGVEVEGAYKLVHLAGGGQISCYALLIATGVSVRLLDVPGVDRLTGAGIYYGAALTEATFYRKKNIYIVGGANSAGQAAVFFSNYASTVTILVRANDITPSMSQYLVDQIHSIGNIRVLHTSEVVSASGDNHLEGIRVQNRETGVESELPADAMFIFIGAAPRTDMVASQVERDPTGFILTGPDLFHNGKWPPGWTLKRNPYLLETSCPGIFAAGDVRHGSIKRVASAVGEGSVTVALVHQYLKTV